MPTQRAITLEELSQHFHLPEKVVAKRLGVCLTSLKKLCRQHGIHRWPYRKLKSIEKKVEKLENLSQNPAEDANTVRAKIHALTEEKKRLPFTGAPSCAYGGVRRMSAQSSPSSMYDVATALRAGSPAGSCWTSSGTPYSPTVSSQDSHSPRSGSPMTAGGSVSCRSKLAERLRMVGSVQEHRQRMAAQMGLPAQEEMPAAPAPHAAEQSMTDLSEYGYSSGDDVAEQPDDEREEGLLYGSFAGPIIFDAPVCNDGFGMDMPPLSCAEEACILADDMFADDLAVADDFFTASAF